MPPKFGVAGSDSVGLIVGEGANRVSGLQEKSLPPAHAAFGFGWGRCARYSKGGATVNATVDDRDSDMGRGAVYHDNLVRVDRVG